MELKQLNQFVVLSEALSFRKAASRLHMTQPPLSISIRALEDELGVRLFERRSTGIELTDEGRTLLGDARRALYYAQRVRDSAQMLSQGRAGTLRVDFVASSTIKLLPRVLAEFRAVAPNVDLRLNESTADLITDALRECRIDVGLIRYPAEIDASLSMEIVERSTLVIALPLDHPLAKSGARRLQDFRDEPFIFFENLAASTSHASALLACHHAGFIPNIVQQVSHAQTLLSLVESGMGVSLVPDTYRYLARRRVCFVDLVGIPDQAIGIGMVCRADEVDRPLIRAFRDAALTVDE